MELSEKTGHTVVIRQDWYMWLGKRTGQQPVYHMTYTFYSLIPSIFPLW